MTAPIWAATLRYGFALLVTAVALLMLDLPVVRQGSSSGALILLLAVLLSSWRGGMAGGLLSTAMAAVVTFRFDFSTWRSLRLVLFVCDGVLISVAVSAVRTAWRRAEASAESRRLSEEQYRRIVETADEGIWLLDAEGLATYVNARGAAMLGRAPEEVIGQPLLGYAEGAGGEHTGELSTDDVDTAAVRAMSELLAGRPARFDLRLRRRDDTTLWVRVSASPVIEGGEFRGALAMISDVTDRVAASAALRRSEARFRRLSESGMIGVAMFDLDGVVHEANDEFLRTVGEDRGALAAGRVNWTAKTAPEFREQDRRSLRDLRTTGVCPPFVKEYERKDGGRIAVMVGAARMEGPNGAGEAECVSFVLDVSARRRAEEALRLLAETGELLAASFGDGGDVDAPLAGLARLTAAHLADFCFVDVLGPDGLVRRASATRNADPASAEAFEVVRAHAPDPNGPSAVVAVLRSGRPMLMSEVDEGVLREITIEGWHREAVLRLGVTSIMVVPLTARGRTFGAASFAMQGNGRRFDVEDLALAEELARRCALAVDNARLYREAQDALRRRDEAQALADALLEAAPVGVAFFDADLRYVRINRELAAVNFLPVEAHLGRPLREVLPEVARQFEPVLRGVLETGRPVLNAEVKLGSPGGPTCWMANYYPARDAAGRVIGVGLTLSDVTEARRAERELREAKEAAEAARARADVILASITDGFFAVDRDWVFTYVNPQAELLLSQTSGDLLGRRIWDVFPDARGTEFEHLYREAIAAATAIEFEAFYPATGAWFEVHAYPSADGLSVYFRDTSERRRAEEALRRSERQFRTLAEAIPQMVWVARPDGTIEYLNRRWSEYTGLDTQSLAAAGWQQTIHPDDLGRSLERWYDAVSHDEAVENLERLRRGSDHAYRWHLTRALPVRGDDGRVIAWFGTSTDIDDRHRAEEGLRFLAEASATLGSSLDYHATLAAVARLAVPDLADWCLVDVAESAGALRRIAAVHADPDTLRIGEPFSHRHLSGTGLPCGPSRVALTGRSELAADLVEALSSDVGVEPRHLEVVRELGLKSVICTPLVARGRVLGAITLVSAESGRRYGQTDLALAEDLARRAAQAVDNARLYAEAHAARLDAENANAAKDRFLAALSHELRTPLTPVLVGVTAMLEDPDLPESVRPVLDVTRRNVALEARLIDDLLDVTRITQGKLRLERSLVEAHGLIRQAVEICRDETAAAGIRLDLDLEAHARHILCDPARVQQILWNLVKNAVKFTPRGGRIAVSTCNPGAPDRPDPRLVIEVSDTGIGIDPEVLPRVFNAFEQGDASITRQFGGLGLGLAISRSLAEAHGGRLSAASPGRGLGTTFTLELPTVAAPDRTEVADRPSPPAIAQTTTPRSDGQPLRILLAEDNVDTLRVMARLLRHRGHRVTAADGVESALRSAEAEGPFDLVISDIGLPDGSGLDLIVRLRQHQSLPLPAIALSGYGTDDDLRKSRDAGFLNHLTKPVDFPTLEAAIRRAVAGQTSPAAP